MAAAFILFGLVSILFLSFVLLGFALRLRGQWDQIASESDRTRRQR